MPATEQRHESTKDHVRESRGRSQLPGRWIQAQSSSKLPYRGRNVIERFFNQLKQWRGMATRYDKYARTYRAAVHLAAVLIWLRPLGDTL